MKKHILCLAIAIAHLITASESIADEQDNSPEHQKKVPPGLQKKGGLPPGQAKKRAKQEAQNANPTQQTPAPASPAVTAKVPEAAKPPTPPTAPEVAKPVTPEPPGTGTPTPAVTKTPETAKPPAKVSPEVVARREKLQRYVTDVDTMAQKPEVRDRLIVRLNVRLEVPLATIEAEQKTYPGVGLGGLLVAHHISRFSKQPADSILADHKKGKSWGEIAGERKVSLGDLIERMQEAKESARNAERAAR